MLRNKEFKIMLFVMGGIALSGSLLGFAQDMGTGLLLLFLSGTLLLTAILFTRRRYMDIRRLSDYLRRICSGDYSLDLRDNQEGELSILKSDIYKVTLLLSKQAEMLKGEKQQLADALSDISHQLKTPLTSMMMMADLLSKPDLAAEKRTEFTKTLTQQLQRMEWLLSSLLKLSRLDAGTVEFKKERVLAATLIDQAVKPLLIPMELRNQKLVLEGEEQACLLADINWTVEALINILKNCMEHNGDGGTLTIRYSENPIYTEILIEDTGKGIEKEDLPYIFKRFFRGKNAGQDSVGIGLALAHSIITAQNGNITVTSRPGEGSCFSVKFYKQIA
jgi:signal transduction histidine kinase